MFSALAKSNFLALRKQVFVRIDFLKFVFFKVALVKIASDKLVPWKLVPPTAAKAMAKLRTQASRLSPFSARQLIYNPNKVKAPANPPATKNTIAMETTPMTAIVPITALTTAKAIVNPVMTAIVPVTVPELEPSQGLLPEL